VVEVFEHARDAVVNISTTRVVRMQSLGLGGTMDDIFNFGRPLRRDRRVESVGSGVVVHESGYIVTNAHVVAQASDVQVTFADGSTLPADTIAVDQEHDLAVLKVSSEQELPALKLGRSDDLMVGENVIAIGNPLGLQHTVTTGIVSALNRDLHFSEEVIYRGLIQTDAPINPGNSGGPLLNIEGELIGINSAIRGDAQNIGFAIPVDRLWELLPGLLDIERRERVRFGLGVSGVEAKVVSIRPDSPAAKAGLAVGDCIARLNGQTLRDGIDYYVQLLAQKPESEVKLAVRRGNRTLEVAVPLVSVPIPDGRELAKNYLGLELAEVPPELKSRYDLPPYVGIITERVVRNSPADRAGIVATDVILRLNNVPVRKLTDVGLALEQTGPGERLEVEGLRLDGRHSFLWRGTLVARGKL
jgi:serine protease Do